MIAFTFYALAITAVASGLFVVLARNPVHSVLWLILTFFTAAGMFVMMGAEFLAMLLLIVYVGAVAVLFLFVVMMLDVDFAELKGEMVRYAPVGLLIGVILLMELGMVFGVWARSDAADGLRQAVTPEGVENTKALGALLYTKYVYLFQAAGMVLFVAMVGAIVLTLRHREDIKRQNILSQIYRDPAKAIVMRDVKPGQGL